VINELNLKTFVEHKKDIENSNLLSKGSFYEYIDQLNKEANVEVDFTKDGYEVLNNVLKIYDKSLDETEIDI